MSDRQVFEEKKIETNIFMACPFWLSGPQPRKLFNVQFKVQGLPWYIIHFKIGQDPAVELSTSSGGSGNDDDNQWYQSEMVVLTPWNKWPIDRKIAITPAKLLLTLVFYIED